MRRAVAAMAAGAALLAIPAASAVSDPTTAEKTSKSQGSSGNQARDVVEQTAEDVLSVLRDPALSSEQRLKAIEQIVIQIPLHYVSAVIVGYVVASVCVLSGGCEVNRFRVTLRCRCLDDLGNASFGTDPVPATLQVV